MRRTNLMIKPFKKGRFISNLQKGVGQINQAGLTITKAVIVGSSVKALTGMVK